MVLASLPPQALPVCQFTEPVPRVLGKGRPKLGWESWPEALSELEELGADLKYCLRAELAGFLGLCSCLLGSEGALSLASQVMGPLCWRGSHLASWVCLSRKCQERSERSYETPRGRVSFLKPTT
uniref:Uncharacterized protein n=1 Tax=Rousettus aegyptiacus TaxID=9407 RepID=A0A7J8KAX9_ROUAE|nr:hypothetical protein HJG63_007821 [Rousettus aegyptiacus]